MLQAMNPIKIPSCCLILTILFRFQAFASESEKSPKQEIEALSSPVIAVRWEAVNTIQTLDDAAIPPACLPLLKDDGFSIRRQAARAIGSRFDQISEPEKPIYLKALRKCASEGPDDVTLICHRAIGLLERNFTDPYFSVSPHNKWVLYEQRRLPVVMSVKGGFHGLLSPVWIDDWDGKPDLLKLAITNERAEYLFNPHWNPSGDALAFSPIIQRRFFNPVCIWVAGDDSIKVLEPDALKTLLPKKYPDWGTTTEFVKWDGNKAIVRIYNCADPDSDKAPNDPGVLISYDIRTKQIARKN